MAETLESIAEKITALGVSMNERFARVDGQFAKIDERFAKVDQRFVEIDARFAGVDARFASMDLQFASMDVRFARMDSRFGSIDNQLADLKAHLGVKIEAVDHKVELAYEAIVALRDRVDTVVTNQNAMASRLENHEIRILALESRRSASE